MSTSLPRKIAFDVVVFTISQVALYYGVKYLIGSLEKRNSPKRQANQSLIQKFNLTEHEEVIATEIITPDELTTTFKEIGGLDSQIQDIKETVIFPLLQPSLFQKSNLLSAPRGVLLYGPPGCGKTMLAKCIAKESGATFINLHVSTLTEKWFGESQKLVHAVFSLARKLSPCIVFIDEIDSFLRTRSSTDHEAMSTMKAEFMTLWDGLASGDNARILIMGATNRPNDIDKAILRRMPKRYAIPQPDREARKRVLQLLLQGITLDSSFDVDKLVDKTTGMSGSDLKELCRNAAMQPVKEFVRTLPPETELTNVDTQAINIRPLKYSDFMASFPSKSHEFYDEESGQHYISLDGKDLD